MPIEQRQTPIDRLRTSFTISPTISSIVFVKNNLPGLKWLIMLGHVEERHDLSWTDCGAVVANQHRVNKNGNQQRHGISTSRLTPKNASKMSRYFIPTDHDAVPQRIILNRFFPFVEDLVERAIERADPQDGAEDIVTAFLESHQEELDSTFDAFVMRNTAEALRHDEYWDSDCKETVVTAITHPVFLQFDTSKSGGFPLLKEYLIDKVACMSGNEIHFSVSLC